MSYDYAMIILKTSLCRKSVSNLFYKKEEKNVPFS